MLWMPMAARVPMTVAMRADSTAMVRVVLRALIKEGSWKSCSYRLRENPDHLPMVFPALKLKMINVAMGAYKNNSTRPK